MEGKYAVDDLFFVASVSLVLFLICREIVCWYFKTNKIVMLLEDILFELKKNDKP